MIVKIACETQKEISVDFHPCYRTDTPVILVFFSILLCSFFRYCYTRFFDTVIFVFSILLYSFSILLYSFFRYCYTRFFDTVISRFLEQNPVSLERSVDNSNLLIKLAAISNLSRQYRKPFRLNVVLQQSTTSYLKGLFFKQFDYNFNFLSVRNIRLIESSSSSLTPT